jgi:hypothetical protein
MLVFLVLMLGLGDQTALAAGTDPLTGTEARPQFQTETPAPETGTIKIEVVNRSGGDLPLGADVLLYGYDGNQVTFEKAEPLSQEGIVVFEEIPLVIGRVYVAATEHQGVRYGSTLAEITAETREANIEIAVFDATSDLSVLSSDQWHIFVEFQPDSTQVIMLILLSNSSVQTVVGEGEGEPAFQLQVPQNALNLQVQKNVQLRYMQTEDGFGVADIRPADAPYEITFGFQMPTEGDRLDFEMPVPLETGSAIVFIPDGAAQLESDLFESEDKRDFRDTTYSIYSSEALRAGEALSFSLVEISDADSPLLSGERDSDLPTELLIGLVVLGVALIVVGLYVWWRNRQKDRSAQGKKIAAAPESSQAEDLMDAIIALEDLYKVGELSEKEYQQRRAKLKERLREAVEIEETL